MDYVLHIDLHLAGMVQQCGVWSYLVLFLIVFCETGLVITPFLPGDSLLFAVGIFAAHGSLSVTLAFSVLTVAAILGDTVNYWIGYLVGPRVFSSDRSRILNRDYLRRTKRFYARHGAKTIVLARFAPILRTFAPFVAGVGRMDYGRFLVYNVIGGIVWVALFVFGGYVFHDIPIVKEHFSLVVLVIIVVSILPGVIELMKHRSARQKPSR